MDWTRAIEINQAALRKVVQEIYVILEIVLDGTIAHLPLILQRAAYRLLVPAESALRRLIVIAARDLKVKLPKPNLPPKGTRIASKASRPLNFQLYDTRKNFFRKPAKKYTKLTPRIHFFDGPSMVTISAPPAEKKLNSTRLIRRFEAFKRALENIPHHAKRLALWQVKRAKKINIKFTDPLRPGAPPGRHRSLKLDIDLILKECHGLAMDLARAAPS